MGDADQAHFGASVASAGDVNGDGSTSSSALTATVPVSRASLRLHGLSSGLSSTPSWTVTTNKSAANLGFSGVRRRRQPRRVLRRRRGAQAGISRRRARLSGIGRRSHDDACVHLRRHRRGIGRLPVAPPATSTETGSRISSGRSLRERRVRPGTSSGVLRQRRGSRRRRESSTGPRPTADWLQRLVGGRRQRRRLFRHHRREPSDGNTGAAYAYLGSSTACRRPLPRSFTPPQLDANVGFAVAGVGDTDGDGFGDVAVGELHIDISAQSTGATRSSMTETSRAAIPRALSVRPGRAR